jgi:DNA repair exonuclease SbcCD nuclease subunit
MTGFRFLHLADLHLETRFGGRAQTRDRLRRATLEAFEAAIDFAIERELHAVLVAGDLYDDELLSIHTEFVLGRQLQRLDEAGIWFIAVCGNHDPGGANYRSAQIGLETSGEKRPRERVHVFRNPLPEKITVTDRKGMPVGVVVGAGHPTEREGENLAASFPRIPSELAVVGLLHTHVASAKTADSHDRYAPSGQQDFEATEYSYWALGHIHQRQRAVVDRPVYYSGNLQGRNPRETGEKGGYLVEARPGVDAEPEFVRFAPVQWERLRVDDLHEIALPSALVTHLAERIDALGADAANSVGSRRELKVPRDAVAGLAQLAVRIELVGETPLARTLRSASEREAFEEELQNRTGALEVQLRADEVTRPVDREALLASPSALACALELIAQAEGNSDLLDELAPAILASDAATGSDPSARIDYLHELLSGLSEELIERSLAAENQ